MTTSSRFSDEELAAWRVNILSWQLIARCLDRQLMRDSGMPHAYYAILVALNSQRDRSLPLSRIADQLDYSQSRTSHAVARLEESGWVRRLSDEKDRRVTSIRLTAEGLRALASASAGHIAEVRRLFFANLDEDDLADIARIGRKLLGGLTEGNGGLTEGNGGLTEGNGGLTEGNDIAGMGMAAGMTGTDARAESAVKA